MKMTHLPSTPEDSEASWVAHMKIDSTRVVKPGFSTSTEGEAPPWVAVMKMGDDPHTPALRRDHLPPPTENSEASWTTLQ